MAEIGNNGQVEREDDAVADAKDGDAVEGANVFPVLQWEVSVSPTQCILPLADAGTALPESMAKSGQETEGCFIEHLIEAGDSESLLLTSNLLRYICLWP
jgi:hypothetical protein